MTIKIGDAAKGTMVRSQMGALCRIVRYIRPGETIPELKSDSPQNKPRYHAVREKDGTHTWIWAKNLKKYRENA